MLDVIVKLLEADDFAVFRTVRLEALGEAPAAFGSSREDWLAFSDDEWRRRVTENAVFVALVGRAPVGVMGLFRERGAKTAHRGSVVMVYVRESFRGQGVSSRMLDALENHARAAGIRQLELVVSVENPVALKFYRRRGFDDVGRIPGALLLNGREVDEIVMARRIDR